MATKKKTAKTKTTRKPRASRSKYMECPFDGCRLKVPKADPLSCSCDAAESLRQARAREIDAAWMVGHKKGRAMARTLYAGEVRRWKWLAVGACLGAFIVGCVLAWVLVCG